MNPALRKLPRISAIDPAAPEYLIIFVTNDNADVWPEAVFIDHPVVVCFCIQDPIPSRRTRVKPNGIVTQASNPYSSTHPLSTGLTGEVLFFWEQPNNAMALAIFDLDNTLLAGDSDHRWGEFLVEKGLVDAANFARTNDQFYEAYQAGNLDMMAYLQFVLAPLTGKTKASVRALQRQFMTQCVEPMLLDKAFALIDHHRVAGDQLLLMTATHSVVAEPVAARLGFQHWLGSAVGLIDGFYTGKPEGQPCFQSGKVAHLAAWRSRHTNASGNEDTWFYSDSHNDLPLLTEVGHPVAVDPDPLLAAHAERHGWTVLSLRP